MASKATSKPFDARFFFPTTLTMTELTFSFPAAVSLTTAVAGALEYKSIVRTVLPLTTIATCPDVDDFLNHNTIDLDGTEDLSVAPAVELAVT